jgi:hypothetical protein
LVALSLVSAGQAKSSEVDYLRALGGLGMGLEGGREANRYPPNPIRYFRHLVGAWFTASSCGGGQGEALPLPGQLGWHAVPTLPDAKA